MSEEEFRTQILALEAQAAAGIERDLDGLRGVHGDVIAFIEQRWLDWLERRTHAIETAFYAQFKFE